MMEPMWVWLYNARGGEELARWLAVEAGRGAPVAEWWREKGRAWWAAVEPHWRRYRRFVERWVRGALTEADWRKLIRRIAPDPAVIQRWFFPREAPRWTVAGWLWRERETAPLGIIREAYIEIVERMFEERYGVSLRPRFCTACGRLFEPDRVTQHYCSAPCRFRVHQRNLRARRKQTRQLGEREGSQPHVGPGSAPSA
jgi:hypothetical protein